LGFLAAAALLHKLLLHNIFRLPGTFFDVTPKGRILARVSKDVDVVDSDLPRVLDNFIFVAFKVTFR
jgi:ABC-type multidrug transport system fused ATPase/permease subunit